MSSGEIGRLVRQLPTQYPFVLVDRILEHDAAGRLVAAKNVTGAEDFFAGHFPGQPVMPGVLILESLAQAAGIWLLKAAPDPRAVEIRVVGFDATRFRRPVVPGDQLRLEVRLVHRRGDLVRFHGDVRVGEARAAESRLLLQVATLPPPKVDPLARVAKGAVLEPGVRVGPFCVVGGEVRIGRGSVLDSNVVIDGDTRIGERNHFFPFSSIGLVPQDLKFHGEPSRLEIGDRNTLREGTTVHRGTQGGGALTRIGSDNLLMAQVHVAHDCRVGDHTIFANAAALAGHVEVQDYATIGAFSGVHQFCRVGTHSFMGGATIATRDVLPYSLTVGNRAHLFGLNLVGLRRRGFGAEAVRALRQAYRVLLQSRLPLAQALARLESEGPHTEEVRTVVAFIRGSARGVVLSRRGGRGGETVEP
ncbi:MAG TPA: acyl-ACP--UDP-N-acetylglucosamine O-acyltransferase [Vicinamibacteria bacterium]|nr:acyl-ACP--UDP-N-acetylglucosamine O-acyltransferase [Vicinamibacteria bacterium]